MAKILVVEDSNELRNQLKLFLSTDGHEVIEAIDGKHGYEICMKATGPIDIIIMDQNMPGMTGLEMIRAIRPDPRYKDTPVIFHTTESKFDLRFQGKDLGVKGWLVKPANPGSLKRLVGQMIS